MWKRIFQRWRDRKNAVGAAKDDRAVINIP
jgi:hypothetical protein